MPCGLINEEDIAKVREASDLATIVGERSQLKQKGRDIWCCCPLHQEKTPSFKIDPSTQLWHCFGCDEGGDVFGFIMKADNLTFPEAVRKLADRAHIELSTHGFEGAAKTKQQRLKDICKETADFYHTRLMRGADEASSRARQYLASRKLGGDIPKTWNLGFAPGRGHLVNHLSAKGYNAQEMVDANVASYGADHRLRDRFFDRIMFPINNSFGEVVAFGGRVINNGEPKYLNSQETPIFHKSQVLYGLDKAKASMTATGCAIVTEGYTDVIAMHEAGLTSAVATLGTALTKNHIRQLARHAGKRIVYLFDGDRAGQRATERALQFIDESITPEASSKPIELYALTLPDGQDPQEYLSTHSADDMRNLIDNAVPLILFGIEHRLARHDKGSAEGRAAALEDALSVLAPIKDSILAKDYAIQIASILRFRESDVLDRLSRMKPAKTYGAEESAPKQSRNDGPRRLPRISNAEKNRLALEREFLSAIAQNPIEFIDYADTVPRIDWHDSTHAEIARCIVSTLMEKLDSTPVEIVEAASKVAGNAPSVLTAAIGYTGKPKAILRFLSEELLIGDAENRLASLKLKADDSENSSMGGNYQEIVDLQARLSDMKATHIRL